MLSKAIKDKRKVRAKTLLDGFHGGAHKMILFTNEKVFTVEQFLNKQNDQVYSKSRLNSVVQRAGHLTSVMVFAGIMADGKTPLVFVPQGIKVNANNYLEMFKSKFFPWNHSHFGNKQWIFQQDGVPAHKANIVQSWCQQNFPNFIAFDQWPPSSPNLNPMDYSV